jgi:hypothetical protein
VDHMGVEQDRAHALRRVPGLTGGKQPLLVIDSGHRDSLK